MNNNDHSKTKLLNKNIKVTDRDIYEFNAWIKGKKITPKLMEKFDDVSDYEDFMYDYDPTENYSVALIEFDKPETYAKGSEGYEYLSSIDKATYDQIIANLAKNDLKIEYNDANDEFRVYSDKVEESSNLELEVGEYDKESDTYKKLSSLDRSGYESLMSKIKDKLDIKYSDPDDKFIVTKTESMNYPIEPGVYKSDTKEYKKLDRLVDDEWTDYLDELAKYGLAIEYDNLNDSFVVTGSDNFSNSEREKVSAEMLEKAKTDGVIQKKPNGKWGIISIQAGEWWIPNYDTRENAEAALAAYHANKSNTERTFTIKSVDLSDFNDNELKGILICLLKNSDIKSIMSGYDYAQLVSDLIEGFEDIYPEMKNRTEFSFELAHDLLMKFKDK